MCTRQHLIASHKTEVESPVDHPIALLRASSLLLIFILILAMRRLGPLHYRHSERGARQSHANDNVNVNGRKIN
jgi:hypothetical protein